MNNQMDNRQLLEDFVVTGNLKEIKILFENGVDICAQNNEAIILASICGHLEVVKFLFENGADICARYNCAIRNASSYGHLEIVKFLFENGANNYAEYNCAICNASSYGRLEVVKYLLNIYENDDNLIYLLNEIYQLKIDFNKNLINKIDILIWAIKLNKYSYFKDHFNEEYEIYDFIFNYKFGYEFGKFMKNKQYLKNKYLHLETICKNEN